MTSRGVVIFGVNNQSVDYVQLAIMAAAFVRANMPDTKVCLITDAASRDWHKDDQVSLSERFDDIVILPEQKELFVNARVYRDTRYYSKEEQFRNESRATVYDLSPYDETLLIDCDYLVCSNSLAAVWGTSEEIMINMQATSMSHVPLNGAEFRLNPFGIKMYWATVIYFRKGAQARTLFSLVSHIKENWEFYKLIYDFPGKLFRNDYAFSIAIHMLNGQIESNDYVVPLPDDTILTALDTDQFYKIGAKNQLNLFVNDTTESWKFYCTKVTGLNVHCMNKLSLLNNMTSIMETLDE